MEKGENLKLSEIYSSVLALIPAYNASETVAEVVRHLKALDPSLEVLVVDDGSSDGTGDVARLAGARVIRHDRNRGKGAALRTGFEEFLRGSWKALVTLDADGQHSPDEVPRLIEAWKTTGADIVIGERKKELGKMPLLRIVTNSISTFLVSASSGRRIPDSQSGFRLITRDVISTIKVRSDGYEAESELLIKAARSGFRIVGAPISTIYRNERSHINPFKQPMIFILLILRSLFWRFEIAFKSK